MEQTPPIKGEYVDPDESPKLKALQQQIDQLKTELADLRQQLANQHHEK